jgi:hypothetical protein
MKLKTVKKVSGVLKLSEERGCWVTGSPFLLCHPLPFGQQHLIAHARHLPSRCPSRVASGTILNPINNSLGTACVVLGVSYSVVVLSPASEPPPARFARSTAFPPIHLSAPGSVGARYAAVPRFGQGAPLPPFGGATVVLILGRGWVWPRCGASLARVSLRFFCSGVSFFLAFLSRPCYTILR